MRSIMDLVVAPVWRRGVGKGEISENFHNVQTEGSKGIILVLREGEGWECLG